MFVPAFTGFDFHCVFPVNLFRDFKKAAGGYHDDACKDHLQNEIGDAKSIHNRRKKNSFANDRSDRKKNGAEGKYELWWHSFSSEFEIGPMMFSVVLAAPESLDLRFQCFDPIRGGFVFLL